MGLEPMIPAFEQAKTVHALDRTATVIGKKDMELAEVAVLVLMQVLRQMRFVRPLNFRGKRFVLWGVNKIP
jgi:hypothetical protein